MFSQQSIFQTDKLPENLVSKEESYTEHKLGQTSRVNLDKFGIGNDVPVIVDRHCSQTVRLMA